MMQRKPKKTPIKGEAEAKPTNIKGTPEKIKEPKPLRQSRPAKTPIKSEDKPVEHPACSICGKKRLIAIKSKKICAVCNKKRLVEKGRVRREAKKQKKQESTGFLTNKLDKIFSIYVRLKYADDTGNVQCFTCTNTHHYKAIQNGHFQSRRYMSTRFHVNNCRPQCYACNVGLHGQQYIFGSNLDKEMGSGTAETMVLLSKQQKKFSAQEFQELIKYYTEEVANIKLQKGIVD
jgi:hypothetical protein